MVSFIDRYLTSVLEHSGNSVIINSGIIVLEEMIEMKRRTKNHDESIFSSDSYNFRNVSRK